MPAKKQIGRDDKALLKAIRDARDQLVDQVWRAEHALERDRKLIGRLDELIAKSDEES